jgi:acyl carrier protein
MTPHMQASQLLPIENRILEIFSGQLHTEVPSLDTDLLDSGILDSLKFVELLLALETELAVKLHVEELELDNFRSIQKISRFLSERGQIGNNSNSKSIANS